MSSMATELGGIAQTLLIPLYFRALETQRSDGLFRDDRAVELVARMNYDFSKLHGYDLLQTTVALRVRELDRCLEGFLDDHPRATVVNLGCGLDTRFQRLDNGLLQWVELDLPRVIALRRFFFEEGPRYRFVASSVLDPQWMEAISPTTDDGLLFLAEGLFPYFQADQVQGIIGGLQHRFPGSTLVFDAISPWQVQLSHLHPALTISDARFQWGLGRAEDLEDRCSGIRLVQQVYYFDDPRRLGSYALLRFFPPIRYGFCVVAFQLDFQAQAD